MKKHLPSILLLILLSLVAVLRADSAHALQTDTPPTDPETVIRTIYGALSAGDVDGAMELIAEDAVTVRIPPPPGMDSALDKAGTRASWEQFAARNGRVEITELYVHGDKVAFSANVTEDLFTSIGVPYMAANYVAIVQDGRLKSSTITWTEASQAIADAAFATEANKEVIRRGYQEMWSEGNLDLADEIHTADVLDRHTGERGIDGIKWIVNTLRTAFPDLSVTVENQVAEGDVVATEVTFNMGAYQGGLEELFGVPDSAIGREIVLRGVDFARFNEEGKIVETWGTHDDLGFLQQFGLELVPADDSSASQ